ncbi:DUF2247 family protein [Terrabacter sp. MAHUQ-38]|uniref:DUF2247 family protein n=1 Tax=unclassified Terrabacter TaxID=2630222 RepID=UPI00165E46E9|nr:DUF2247 family protein [Terrabacter sp. MAHUQ-38]MBC9822951.1 DUF2247 family protein [Terrabacter sp. MAHUQ-38]
MAPVGRLSNGSSFVLPADFVAARVALRPAELAHGFRSGYLDEQGVVQLAEHAIESGAPTLPSIEELGLLLSEEYGRVPELVTEMEESDPSAPSEQTNVWLYLVLAWIYDHRDEFADPLAEIETVHADFDYPEGIEGLVGYLPAAPGQPSGPGAVEARWKAFLDRQGTHYARRAVLD